MIIGIDAKAILCSNWCCCGSVFSMWHYSIDGYYKCVCKD